jgi:hypothetical protein
MIWSMGPLWVIRAWWSMPEKPIMARRPFLISAVCPASGNDQKVRKRRISRAKLSCNTQERAQRARQKTTVGVRKHDAEESKRVKVDMERRRKEG